MCQVNKEVAKVLRITPQHATTKNAQTIGMLERSHASLRKALKIETGARRSVWHKYANILVLNYNTSYPTSIGRELSRVFQTTSEIQKWASVRKQHPLQYQNLTKMFLNKRKCFSTISARTPCKHISSIKRTNAR